MKLKKRKQAQGTTHKVQGKFLGFIQKSGSPFKYIKLRVGEREIPIKLAKEIRKPLGEKLVEGDYLSVLLEQKGLELGSKLKLKTECVERLVHGKQPQIFTSTSNTKKGKILLCYKSSCIKRGGQILYYALLETLKQLGLQDQVKVELMGCQKQCKKAPSFILMPGNITYNYVNPNELSSLLAAHYQVDTG